MKQYKYKNLRAFAVLCKTWSVLGAVIVFIGIFGLIAAEETELAIIGLPLGILGAVIHFFTFQAATELIILLIHLERNTRGPRNKRFE